MLKRIEFLGLVLTALLWGLAPAGAQTQASFVELEVEFLSNVKLAGTLTLPQPLEHSAPVVLFVHGSGRQDRNEGPIRLFNTLARELALHGIVSLRYDKRGVGRSGGSFRSANFTDLVNDAKAAVQFLRSRPDVDAAKVFAVGHSEGGYIVAILAADGFAPGGIVSLAGPVQPLDQILLWQNEAILRVAGASEAAIRAQLDFIRAFIDFVKRS